MTNYYQRIILISFIFVTINIAISGGDMAASDPPKPYLIFGYCFEENGSFCSTDTEVILYLENRTSDNISTTVCSNGMYGFSLGNLKHGWSYGENITLILKRGSLLSKSKTNIQKTEYANQFINLTFIIKHGDFNIDGCLDLEDFVKFCITYTGTEPQGYVNQVADFDKDADVDLVDFIKFIDSYKKEGHNI